VLRLQLGRYAAKSGFEVMTHVADFQQAMTLRNVHTAFQWNLSEHRQAFFEHAAINGNLWLLIAAPLGILLGRDLVPARFRRLLALWLILPLSFSLWIWEPNWDHYYIQYLPSLSLGAALLFATAMRGPQPRKALAVTAVTVYTLLGTVTRPKDPTWYQRVTEITHRAGSKGYFSFSPLLHAAGGTEPSCGVIDPMNVYGQNSLSALQAAGPLARFNVTSQTLIDCLGSSRPVVVDNFTFWFLDPPLLAHLANTKQRLIFFSPRDQQRFEALLAKAPPPTMAPAAP